MEKDGLVNSFTKKEIASLTAEREKLIKNLSGVIEMDRLPGAIFIIDSKKEETAVLEAKRLNIPVVGLIDTNCDPDLVDYPIPGNDDAIKSIKLITSFIAESVLDGKKRYDEVKAVMKEMKEKEEESLETETVIAPEIEEEVIKKLALDKEEAAKERPVKARKGRTDKE